MPPNPSLSIGDAWIVLNAVPHLGPVNTRRLLDAFADNPVAIFEAGLKRLCAVKGIGEKAAQSILNWESHIDLNVELEKMKQTEVRFINLGSDGYPDILKTLYDPPVGLYAKGPLSLNTKQPKIAIVGSRRTTLYGLQCARKFAQRLAGMGVCIVSGLARGIDSAAHEGALEVGGDTIAVLGNGIDIVYPPENLDLFRKIAERGVVLSEFVFGRRADRQTFPMRNRIVSGLCDGVLVVESDDKGGSMITAQFAADQGRQVYAIPGRIDNRSSAGCNRLIKEGAMLVSGPEDIIEDLNFRFGSPVATSQQSDLFESESESEPEASNFKMNEVQQRIVGFLKREGESDVDSICESAQIPIAVVNAELLMLELKKRVVKTPSGLFAMNQ